MELINNNKNKLSSKISQSLKLKPNTLNESFKNINLEYIFINFFMKKVKVIVF